MRFDIFGGHLRRGFCEVHPTVREEYPCSVCVAESQRRNRLHDLPELQADDVTNTDEKGEE